MQFVNSYFIRRPAELWNSIWFRKNTAEQVGIFRIALGILVLAILLISFPNWERFYGANGILPPDEVPPSFMGLSWSIFTLNDSWLYLWSLYAIALVATISFILGFHARISTILLFLIYASMLHRNTYLVNGQDQIITMLLFFSMFAPLGANYSLDAYMQHKGKKRQKPKLRSIWPIRLMQLSVALVYVFSAPAKLFDDVMWRNGQALYWVSQSDRWFRFPDAELFNSLPLSWFLTYTTLFVFILFPYLVWFSKTRWLFLGGIALIHFNMLILMAPSVFWFNLSMLVSFILFIPPLTMRKFVRWLVLKKTQIS